MYPSEKAEKFTWKPNSHVDIKKYLRLKFKRNILSVVFDNTRGSGKLVDGTYTVDETFGQDSSGYEHYTYKTYLKKVHISDYTRRASAKLNKFLKEEFDYVSD